MARKPEIPKRDAERALKVLGYSKNLSVNNNALAKDD